MSVKDPEGIDFVQLDGRAGEIVLSISDPLPWGEERRLELLQRKLERYIEFVQGGELQKGYPEAAGKPVRVEIKFAYPPDPQGLQFLWGCQKRLLEHGLVLRYGLLRADA